MSRRDHEFGHEILKHIHGGDISKADALTKEHTAFGSFEELITASGNYRPVLQGNSPEQAELASMYNVAQQERGDPRRAIVI